MTQADDAWTRIKVSPDLPKVYKRAVLSLVAGQPISIIWFLIHQIGIIIGRCRSESLVMLLSCDFLFLCIPLRICRPFLEMWGIFP